MSFRDENKVRKQIEVLKNDYEWFIKHHEIEVDSLRTGFSGMMMLLLHSYRTVCENPNEFDLKRVDTISITLKAGELVKDERDIK